MTNIITIEAICVDSDSVERKKISFNATTSLITHVGKSELKVDYYL